MNRLLSAALCALLLLAPTSLRAAVLPMTDAMAVMDVVHAHVGHSDDLDASMVGEGSYAIAFWKAASGHGAGSALLKKVSGNWKLVKLIRGSFRDVASLQSIGVPPAQAKALVNDLQRADQ